MFSSLMIWLLTKHPTAGHVQYADSPCSVPCPDKISWPAIPPGNQVFTIGSDTYTLQIVGIKDACPSGALKTDFITEEGRTNEGYLVGKIVRVSVPVANDDSITTPEDTPVTATATGNDIPSSDGGNVWSLVGANGGAAHGTVTMTAEGTYTYTPGAGWSGVAPLITRSATLTEAAIQL